MIPNYDPAVIDFAPQKTFQEWVARLQHQLPRYFDNLRTYINTTVLPLLNDNLYGLGQDIASASVISPVNYVTLITGSTPIQTINAPRGFSGSIVLIARDGFTTGTSGNILLAVTIAANHGGMFTWHGALQKWAVVTDGGSGGGTAVFTPSPIIWSWGPAPPISGLHNQGDIFWNTTPTSGLGSSPIIGWVNVQPGANTPGIWKEFGAIGV